MSEAAIYLKDKISRLEREYNQAVSREADYRAKADDMSKKAGEYQVLLRHLKSWDATEFGGTQSRMKTVLPLVTPSYSGSSQIRQLVMQCLKRMDHFTTNELVKAVQEIDPTAKGNSVQGDLSRRKKKGEVLQVGPGLYHSLMFEDNNLLSNNGSFAHHEADDDAANDDETEDDEQLDPFSEEGEENEPGPTFGQIR